MRDLQDWHKKVDLDAKAVQRTLDNVRRVSAPTAPTRVSRPTEPEPELAPTRMATHMPSALRKGRGPRKEETREELLSRLLDPTLTLEETARMLEVCPTTVRRYTNKGILPHERSKGNQRRFKLSSVLAFMESQARADSKVEGS